MALVVVVRWLKRGVGLLSGWLAAWLVSSFLSRCPYRQCGLDPACWPALLLIMAQQPGRSTLCRCVRVYTGVAIHNLTMPDGAGAENCLTVGSDCDCLVDGRRAELLPRCRRSWKRRQVLHAYIVSACTCIVIQYTAYLHEERKSLAAGWGIRFCWVGPAYRIRTNSLQRPTAAVGSYRALGKAINPAAAREGANESASSQQPAPCPLSHAVLQAWG